MKCQRTPLAAEVEKYELNKGIEDGFELWSKVITNSCIVTDKLIKVERENGLYTPYIRHRRGRTFIEEGDYIITDEDGTRHVCGADKIFSRYRKMEE